MYYAHPTAVIDEGCRIGAETRIWHFCHVMPEAVIGEHCVLGQNVMVASRAVLGSGVKVQNNVSIYTGVVCEDDVFLGPSAVFTNILTPRSFINRKSEFKETRIKRGASIGANATILCGITVGEYAMIGAGAVVTRSVADFALVAGNPARLRGWVSKAGRRLDFNEKGEALCPETGECYRMVDGIVRAE